MTARSVAQFVRDQDTARAARDSYRLQAKRLDLIARDGEGERVAR